MKTFHSYVSTLVFTVTINQATALKQSSFFCHTLYISILHDTLWSCNAYSAWANYLAKCGWACWTQCKMPSVWAAL